MRRSRREPTFTEQLALATAAELLAALADLAAQVERARQPAWARRHETLGNAVLSGILTDVQKGAALLGTLDPAGAPNGPQTGHRRTHATTTDGRPGDAVAGLLARPGLLGGPPVYELPVGAVRQRAAGD